MEFNLIWKMRTGRGLTLDFPKIQKIQKIQKMQKLESQGIVPPQVGLFAGCFYKGRLPNSLKWTKNGQK